MTSKLSHIAEASPASFSYLRAAIWIGVGAVVVLMLIVAFEMLKVVAERYSLGS
jgi:hypothetical protein